MCKSRPPESAELADGVLTRRRPGLRRVHLPRRSARRPASTASPASRPARPFVPAQAQPPAATASARWTWSTPSFSGTETPKNRCCTRHCVRSNHSAAAARNAVWGERLDRRLTSLRTRLIPPAPIGRSSCSPWCPRRWWGALGPSSCHPKAKPRSRRGLRAQSRATTCHRVTDQPHVMERAPQDSHRRALHTATACRNCRVVEQRMRE